MGLTAVDASSELFRCFAFHVALLVLKMILMIPLTAYAKYARIGEKKLSKENDQVLKQHSKLHIVWRAHRNDLENVPFFMLIGWFYVTTNPSLSVAKNLFRLFTVSRYVHTLVYAVNPVRQPARFLAFVGGYSVLVYMTIAVLVAVF